MANAATIEKNMGLASGAIREYSSQKLSPGRTLSPHRPYAILSRKRATMDSKMSRPTHGHHSDHGHGDGRFGRCLVVISRV